MSLVAALRSEDRTDVLTRLRSVCASHGLGDLASRLSDLAALVQEDMGALNDAIASIPRGERSVQHSAHHLLDRSGKRLRPMCVVLASRLGSGYSPETEKLAVAAELVHAATLLHDDVVDASDRRRGAPAARTIYGNAASIFAGDWLLVEALRRVRSTRDGEVLDRLLATIDEMIVAESVQLEGRGRLDLTRETYFSIVVGKTASLFRWAMFAGGRAGGLADAACEALEQYGLNLGIAFQLVDDLLDYTGEVAETGKSLFTDLREGKMTYPLILLSEREPSIRAGLEAVLASGGDADTQVALQARLREVLDRSDVVLTCRNLARDKAREAIESLSHFPASRALDALVTVAEATVRRDS